MNTDTALVKRALVRLVKTAQKRSDEPLSDKKMKGMIPLFVDSDSPPDHKCGSCFMRVPAGGDKADCTTVGGGISLSKGVCSFWAKGAASSAEDVMESRMSHKLSGYVEVSKGAKINCASCRFFDRKSDGIGHCALWNGQVKDGQCCVVWDSPEAEAP